MSNPFEILYAIFVRNPGTKVRLVLFDFLLLIDAVILTAWLRNMLYSSLDLRMDIIGGVLIGLTVLTIFNSMVYIGSLNDSN